MFYIRLLCVYRSDKLIVLAIHFCTPNPDFTATTIINNVFVIFSTLKIALDVGFVFLDTDAIFPSRSLDEIQARCGGHLLSSGPVTWHWRWANDQKYMISATLFTHREKPLVLYSNTSILRTGKLSQHRWSSHRDTPEPRLSGIASSYPAPNLSVASGSRGIRDETLSDDYRPGPSSAGV